MRMGIFERGAGIPFQIHEDIVIFKHLQAALFITANNWKQSNAQQQESS